MPDPISVVISTATSMALEKALRLLAGEPRAMMPVLERIQLDVQTLRDAPLSDALDCLREGDMEQYKRSLREAKNRNPFSAHARILYADALIREGKSQAAASIFHEAVHWYGLECPILPEQVRDAYKDHMDIALPGGVSGKSNNIGICNTGYGEGQNGWILQGVAVSAAGIAAAWEWDVGMFTKKIETRLAFQPWAAIADPKEVELVNRRGQNSSPIWWITDRFLVHKFSSADFEVVDLYNPTDRRPYSSQQAQAVFGKMTGSVLIRSSSNVRGVNVNFGSRSIKHWEPRSWGGYESSASHTEVTATPKVVPVQTDPRVISALLDRGRESA